ncbi:Crp/Fnr family transcriptional regulator [Paraburkholderia acidicola]|uniref:Crp/Fnr family transcriptional regulator n=1 Tax=Paraburkholderia acidicola TaxID=1912599 RepID=A0ABV1LI18_9BURK
MQPIDQNSPVPMPVDPWFVSLDPDDRQALLAKTATHSVEAGEFLFRQGDSPDGFYGIVSGFVKVSVLREDGKEAILTVLEPGNWFGEVSAIDGKPRSHDMVAVGRVELRYLTKEHFDRLLHRNSFCRAIALLQARHIRAVYSFLEDATLRSTRARVARRLEWLAHGDTTMASDSRRGITVSQEVLAMMLGITRQTLALELKSIEASGAIAMSYRHITIVSIEQLRRIGNDNVAR